MIQREEKIIVENRIKNDIPTFDRERLNQYTKSAIVNIYNSFSNGDLNNINVRVSKELLNKISNNMELYRISKDYDNIVVQYADIIDYERKEDAGYVKIYTTINFYDNYKNNETRNYFDDKNWNDTWIITYKALSNVDNNCKNCGSEMEYNKEKDVYECKFCRSSFHKDSKDWKIVDIEVEK
ncbi:MAG: hypothetical protein IKG14_01135 [Clostridia bacterium]|nr:hypothetical protein [Clostridia bacterium]